MPRGLSRAELLRGRFAEISGTGRPPYSLPEVDFIGLCEACDDCRNACETSIIGTDDEGYPVLRFGEARCSFCGACATACTTGALDPDKARAWTVIAEVRGSCLSFEGITCRACEETCAPGAIRFRLMTGGRAVPLLNEADCTGCGACAVVCPNQSIHMTSRKAEEVFA
ncbi:Ferredoxin-type protein NapF (periplasmic nitrate reductase) [hydrothermal vent metagenome]|uniref:Ferredoxin-type protein NapF (Periplasmic nitrate reductase) n=1 Tax=hydrothermal vent metagenome TaxID=652676 RepID=A0A3B0TTL7_9ZZZZ